VSGLDQKGIETASNLCPAKTSSRVVSTLKASTLLKPKEIDALKLEAEHTIDLARFV
jgi:hypothetical protein